MKFPSFHLIAFVLTVAPLGGAHAAPQSLALLVTPELTPLVCANGSCRAEFSTYCLQKERDFPRSNAPYEVAAGGRLTLVLTGADGRLRSLPAAPHVRIATARNGHTAVLIELPQRTLAAFGAQHAAIEIGAGVTLIPAAVAGDDNPQSAQDKRVAAGPLRALGRRIVDRGPRDLGPVRALNRLINALPPANGIDPDASRRVWRQALARGFQTAAPEHVARAALEYRTCWGDRAVKQGGVSVRYCIERRHDVLMWKHVTRYWNAVGAGS